MRQQLICGCIQSVCNTNRHFEAWLYPSVFNLTNVACGASALFRKVLLPESLRNTESSNILSQSLIVHCTYLFKYILVDAAAKVKNA